MKALWFMIAGLAPLSPALAQADTLARITGTALEISATGEAHRPPDIVTLSAGVVTQSLTASDAMSENAHRMTATIAALKAAGVTDRDIQTQAVQLNPQYRFEANQAPKPTGYQATNTVNIRFHDMARTGAILDALVGAGANQINGPSFAVAHPDAALDEARVEAVAKARARAEVYAKAAGLHVIRIVSISEAEAAPFLRAPIMAMAKREATPIEPGEQTLSVTLSVTFELK